MAATPAPLERFLGLWAEVSDLGTAAQALSWDQETQMPPKGHGARAEVLSSLAGLRHAKLSSAELHDAVEACAELADPDGVLAAQLREARRVLARVQRVPEELARAKAKAVSVGHEAWKAARQERDFSLFAHQLGHLVQLSREEAQAIAGPGGKPYDALLDLYEPGSREETLVPLFQELQSSLSAWVQAVRESGVRIDEGPLQGSFPVATQLEFARSMATRIGFDFEAGRLDRAAHPFCSGFAPTDVRLTWRATEEDLRPCLFGILHEAGHGLYEQGLPPEWARSPIGGAVSLGVHESQSRLWENLVGRSRAFWEWALPGLQQHFPSLRGTSLEEFWPPLHTVKPSLIRVEADQGTYDLHVIVRFDLERALFAGDLDVQDLPEAWDQAYERALGLRADHVGDGVLQDIHWSMAGFGYFPTYTLGNLIAAQLFAQVERDLGELAPSFRRGDFAPLLEWLRDRIHRHGSRFPASELVERATGRPLGPEDYLALRARDVEEVYGVTL